MGSKEAIRIYSFQPSFSASAWVFYFWLEVEAKTEEILVDAGQVSVPDMMERECEIVISRPWSDLQLILEVWVLGIDDGTWWAPKTEADIEIGQVLKKDLISARKVCRPRFSS